MNRDERTLDTISKEELSALRSKTVAVIGAGGLGGYVVEMLARIGLGHIILFDRDVFDESNLNRQLLATENNVGKVKIAVAEERIKAIRSDVRVTAIHSEFTRENGPALVRAADVVLDCVDNIEARFIIADACKELKIPMIHGAVGAWNGQVMTLMPEDHCLEKIYESSSANPPSKAAASFMPALVASYQVGECIKLLTGKGILLRSRLLFIDMLHNEHLVLDLTDGD